MQTIYFQIQASFYRTNLIKLRFINWIMFWQHLRTLAINVYKKGYQFIEPFMIFLSEANILETKEKPAKT